MKNICSSLIALAIVALRNGESDDAAKLFAQASYSDGVEDLLEELMADNYEAVSLCRSVSGNRGGIKDSIQALSASLAFEESGDLYDDEFITQSSSKDDEDDDGVDNDFLDDDVTDEDEDDLDIDDEEDEGTSTSSSLIRLNF